MDTEQNQIIHKPKDVTCPQCGKLIEVRVYETGRLGIEWPAGAQSYVRCDGCGKVEKLIGWWERGFQLYRLPEDWRSTQHISPPIISCPDCHAKKHEGYDMSDHADAGGKSYRAKEQGK